MKRIKKNWFNSIGGKYNETFEGAVNRYFQGRARQECKLNILVEVAYEKKG